MILLQIALFALGALLVLFVLFSAIRTFVLPRAAADFLPRFVFLTTRRLFELGLRKTESYAARDRVMALYAPVSLLVLPAVWVTVVAVGYMAMYLAIGVNPITTAFTLSGSSLLTLGFAPVTTLTTTVLTFTEATIGLTLVALLIAYLPTIYAEFARREQAVTLLEVRAGSPPSAVEMITRFHRLERMEKLSDLWVEWEIWFVAVEESHTSLAALSFFRSPQPERCWVTAAGAVLDAASFMTAAVDVPRDAQRELCIRAGYLMLRRIADLYRIPHNANPAPTDPISVSRAEFDDACDRLAAAGVQLKPDRDEAWRAFAGWRVNYDDVLITLAYFLMAPPAPWSSDRLPPRKPIPWIGHPTKP